MRSVLTAVFGLCCCVFTASLPCSAAAPTSKSLQIYFVDVEGGQATLVVTPAGQSLLIDTGWPGSEGRDADRIVAAAHQAGITQLDYVLITHYHRDHVGGVPQLVDGIKVGTFLDHGPNLEDSEVTRTDYAAYEKAIEGHAHVVLKPGMGLPIKGLQVEVLAAAGEHITHPLPGAGEANKYCGAEPAAEVDNTENARSVGVLITYGKFRFLDLGDLTKKKELEIACPNNLLGTVDLFLVTHHRVSQGTFDWTCNGNRESTDAGDTATVALAGAGLSLAMLKFTCVGQTEGMGSDAITNETVTVNGEPAWPGMLTIT